MHPLFLAELFPSAQGLSVFAIVAEDSAVGIEDFALADKADIAAMLYDRQIPRPGVIESFHDLVHSFADFNLGRGYGHKFAYKHLAVEVGSEHDVANVVEQDDAEQLAVVVDDGKQVAVRFRDCVDHLLERHLRLDSEEVALDDAVNFK